MDIMVIVAIVIGFGGILVGFVLEKGVISALLQPTAAIIVFGALFGALLLSYPLENIKELPKIFKIFMTKHKDNREDIITSFGEISNKVRKEGLLVLETELHARPYDEFMVHGLNLVVDGVDGETIRKSLEIRIDNMEERHEKGRSMFEAAAGYAPTMGVLGTVCALVNVLGDLSNVAELGPKIAVAFIATLYGVGSANLLFMPIANRLKAIDSEEIITKSMILEGVMLIYSGSNSSLIEERLRGFLKNEEKKATEGE
jgi:chemotaxis protein MotA